MRVQRAGCLGEETRTRTLDFEQESGVRDDSSPSPSRSDPCEQDGSQGDSEGGGGERADIKYVYFCKRLHISCCCRQTLLPLFASYFLALYKLLDSEPRREGKGDRVTRCMLVTSNK